MQFPQRPRDTRSSPIWLSIPALVLGTWVLSAQAPGASQADLERRVAELEARLLKGPGSSTRIKAPFEVIDASGSVLLRVANAKSTTAAVEIYHSGPNQTAITVNAGGKQLAGMGALGRNAMVFVADNSGPRAVLSGEGEIVVLDKDENEVAVMQAAEDGGRVAVGTSADTGGVASLEVDEHGGLVSVKAEDGTEVATLAVDSETGYGSLRIGDDSADVAVLGATKQGAGILAISNSADKVVANVRGGPEGGEVLIGSSAGASVLDLMADKSGAGMLRIFASGGSRKVVLGTNGNGGLLQLINGTGVNAVNLQIGAGNSGYLQLTDGGGNGVVEAGGAPGYGIVRVGPVYDCAARPLKIPQCLVGKQSP